MLWMSGEWDPWLTRLLTLLSFPSIASLLFPPLPHALSVWPSLSSTSPSLHSTFSAPVPWQPQPAEAAPASAVKAVEQKCVCVCARTFLHTFLSTFLHIFAHLLCAFSLGDVCACGPSVWLHIVCVECKHGDFLIPPPHSTASISAFLKEMILPQSLIVLCCASLHV